MLAMKHTVIFRDSSAGKVLELKLKALILDTIHHLSVVESLIEAKVTSVEDWGWKRQLRFYLDSQGHCLVRMVDATFNYTYEYQAGFLHSL